MHKSFIYGRRSLIFALCCLLGLLLGPVSAAGTDASLLSLMRLAVSSRLSIVLLFLACVLPFLIAAYAVLIHNFKALFALAFFRFFAWGFCAWMTVMAFGTAAWLIQPMLQFSDSLSLVLFCVIGIRWCEDSKRPVKKDLLWYVFCIVFTVISDYFFVSPFLATLF